jgi:glycosyltransferase involved in cell wall biosynthesis
MADRPSLTIVIPAYNEAASLPSVLEEVKQYRDARPDVRVVIVDDGSRDATPDVLAAWQGCEGVTIIRHKVNRGYGGALKSGLAQATTDLAVTIDADGQHRLEDVDGMLAIFGAQDADLVVGTRPADAGSLYRRMGKWVIRTLARVLTRTGVTDLNSGCKLYRTSLVRRYLYLCPDSMAFSDVMTLVFASQRHRIVPCPIPDRARRAGKGTISTATAFETVLEILNIIMLFNPLRIFLPLSICCFLAGLLWGIPIVLVGRGVSVGSMLAIVMGLFFFFLGLVAEQLALIRKETINRPSGSAGG